MTAKQILEVIQKEGLKETRSVSIFVKGFLINNFNVNNCKIMVDLGFYIVMFCGLNIAFTLLCDSLDDHSYFKSY